MSYPKIEVVWDDSWSRDEAWSDVHALPDDYAPIRTVGFLLKSTERWYVICQGFDTEEPNKVHGVFYIPKPCVKEVFL